MLFYFETFAKKTKIKNPITIPFYDDVSDLWGCEAIWLWTIQLTVAMWHHMASLPFINIMTLSHYLNQCWPVSSRNKPHQLNP